MPDKVLGSWSEGTIRRSLNHLAQEMMELEGRGRFEEGRGERQ